MKIVPGRRNFLKTIGVVGAGIYAMPFAGAAQVGHPLTVVFSENVQSPEFLSGVALRSSVEVIPICVFQPPSWAHIVQDLRGRHLVGLMDNASYVVFQAVLADQGARFLVSGHHARGHQFMTVPETAGVAATLDRCLSTAQSGYQLREICHGAPKVTVSESSANAYRGKSDWASVIGDCYAQIANGNWSAGLPGTFCRSGSKSVTAQDASVSFVAKV